MPFSRSRAN